MALTKMENTKKRGRWSQEQLQDAMEAVKQGNSVRRASANFGIPRRTLRNHLISGVTSKRIGRPTVLTSDQEKDLCQRIFRLCDIGMPLTSKLLKRSVFTYSQQIGIGNPFSETKKMAGRKWFRLFLKRHPEVASRKAQHMNAARAAKLNRYIVNDHYEKLRHLLQEMKIINKPHLIHDMDEKGCRLTLHKQPKVLAKRGSSNVHIIAEEHAENVTIVACGNAIGQIIPPMILMKGIREKQEWSENLPAGSVIKMTEKGSMNTKTFISWLQHFSQFKPQEKVLLIFDGASSHLDFSIVEEAEKHDITLYCLASNTTHQLQPMDKSVFGPFESYWDDEVLLVWTNKPTHRITKLNFGTIFSKVWPKAATPANVSGGYRVTGIPFDPNIIPDSAFAPSEITIRRLAQNEENDVGNKTEPVLKEIGEKQLVTITKLKTTDTLSQPGSSGLQKKMPYRKRQRFESFSSSESGFSLRDLSSDDESFSNIKEKSPILEVKSNASFKNVLPTPEIEEKKVTPRKKSLNYRAQRVTKDLFKETKGDSQHSTQKRTQHRKYSKKVVEKWYCHLCDEDRVADMRLCNMCMRYIHKECVGLTKSDKEWNYVCPTCNDK